MQFKSKNLSIKNFIKSLLRYVNLSIMPYAVIHLALTPTIACVGAEMFLPIALPQNTFFSSSDQNGASIGSTPHKFSQK